MIMKDNIPHDLNSEEALIGSLLIDGPCINQIRYLIKPEHFYYATNQLLYGACATLAERHKSIDQVTLAQELDRQGHLETCGGAANLSRLISICPTSLDVESYAEIVYRLFVMRELIKTGEHIAELGYSGIDDGNNALSQAALAMSECQHKHTHVENIITPKQVADDIINLIGKYNETGHFLTYGFKTLDNETTGLYGGELVIFGARPGVGKTQLGLDCTENIVALHPSKTILFASVEMTMNMIIERKIARALHISVRDLRTKGYKGLPQTIIDYAHKVEGQNIYYLPQGTSSTEIAHTARKLKETQGLDLLVVDYLQRLPDSYPQHKNETRDQAVGRACANIKQTAVDLDIPSILLCQLSRASEHREDKFPQLTDLRDSGNIEQDADTVLLLHRHMASNPGTLEIMQAKGRQVGCGTKPVTLCWNYETQRYYEGK